MPHFRGKARVGLALEAALERLGAEFAQVVPVKMRDGRTLLLDPRSRTERMAFWTGRYDDEIIAELSVMLPAGATVLDIGANIGWYATAFGQQMKKRGGGRVFAFEPIHANAKRMRQNIAANGLETIVRVEGVALSSESNEFIAFHVETAGGSETGNAIMVEGLDCAHKRNEYAQTVTLDAYCAEIADCHLIKIDVEGAELKVLQGGRNFIKEHRPVIYGEFNAFWAKRFGYVFADIATFAGQLGYRTHPRGSGEIYNYLLKP